MEGLIKKGKITVALDVDDVLALCNALFVEGEDYFDIKWGGKKVEEYKHFFTDPNFVGNQPLIQGAVSFVRDLIERGCEVMFVTSVPSSVMEAREGWLLRHFPFVPEKNIVFTSRKDIVNADIFIDDNPHHIMASKASWPILMRRPWNEDITGVMSANSFDEALCLIDAIVGAKISPIKKGKNIICLVGPSGSGKTDIVQALQGEGCTVPTILTTATKGSGWYKTVPKSDFHQMMMSGCFLQTSSYGGNYYGISMSDFRDATATAKALAVPIDIGGAYAIKNRIGSGRSPDFSVTTIYVGRDKDVLIEEILKKPLSDKEKTLRILSLDAEIKNASLCDYALSYNGNATETAKKIMEVLE